MIDMPVAVAMRYGNPTPAKAIEELLSKNSGLKTLYVAPMYPHYAMSSYETAVKHALNSIDKRFTVRLLKPFYKEENSLILWLKAFVRVNGHVLFSYHGLPVRHLQKSDSTKAHCYSSADCCSIASKAWETCYKHQVYSNNETRCE